MKAKLIVWLYDNDEMVKRYSIIFSMDPVKYNSNRK